MTMPMGMHQGMHVIGAGLGRTGTMSLKFAIEQLSLGPCFHMIEMMKVPERIAVWDRAGKGEKVDWDALFAGFHSTVDWPSATFYRELADHYPKAKVLLTVRDADKWFDSTQATIFKAMDALTADANNPQGNPMGSMVKGCIMKMFDYKMHDRAHCIAVYNKHNDDVRRVIPASRLLEFNVAQGWKPLCEFLGVPVPATPFPSVNSTEEFQQKHAPQVEKFAATQS